MKNWFWIALAASFGIPAIVTRLGGTELSPICAAFVFGTAIAGAAFLLAWAAEAAQKHISQALSLAFLALIAVLPEYAVDIYFAWTAGVNPEYAGYAAANMPGANRLLIGIGWPMIALLFWLKKKQKAVVVDKGQGTALSFLVLATAYSFTIPLKGSLSLVDSGILVTLFALYMWSSSRAKKGELELEGPPAAIAALPKKASVLLTVCLFLLPAAIIYASAEPFAEGLIAAGKNAGIDEFILVQWVAPLASEAPEIIVAAIFALKGNATAALVVLISAKVNQWSLLIGTLPVAYCISAGHVGSLPLDPRQAEEVMLTAAQSAFAIVLLARLRFTVPAAIILFLLFATQLAVIAPEVRWGYAIVYVLLTFILLSIDRERRLGLCDMMRTTIATFKS